jgi:hypothetical protein
MTPESIPGLLLTDELEALLRSDEYPERPIYLDHEVLLTDLRNAA